MSYGTYLMKAAAMACLTLPALADTHPEGIRVVDSYARVSAQNSVSAAAFLVIENHTGKDDRLIGVQSPVAERVELHTHIADDMGVMRMRHVEDGLALPAGGTIKMQRGGDHVMFMGLTQPLVQDDIIPLTLVFEMTGEMTVTVPVDLERTPNHQMPMKEAGTGHEAKGGHASH